MEVVFVSCVRYHLWQQCLCGPLHAKDLCQFAQVDRCGFSDAEDGICQPGHAEVSKFLVEERDSELGCQEWDVLDDSLAHAPLLVLCELHDGRKERLAEQLDPNHPVDLLQLADNVEPDFRELVLQQMQEQREKIVDRALLAQEWGQPADLRA